MEGGGGGIKRFNGLRERTRIGIRLNFIGVIFPVVRDSKKQSKNSSTVC